MTIVLEEEVVISPDAHAEFSKREYTWTELAEALPQLVKDFLEAGGKITKLAIGETSQADLRNFTQSRFDIMKDREAALERRDLKVAKRVDELLDSGMYKCDLARACRIGPQALNRVLLKYFKNDSRAFRYLKSLRKL